MKPIHHRFSNLRALLVLFSLALSLWAYFSSLGSAYGQTNGVLSLNGYRSAFQVPAETLEDVDDFTIEFWLYRKKANYTSIELIIDSQDSYSELSSMANFQEISLDIHQKQKLYKSSHGSVPLRNWTHVAAVGANNELTLYLDGVSQGSIEHDGDLKAFDRVKTIQFGNSSDAKRIGLFGYLDDIRIWSVARTAEEVRKDMLGTSPQTNEGLQGWWTFDEMNVDDHSGFHRHGKLIEEAETILSWSPIPGQNPSEFTLQGEVNSSDGNPVSGAEVRLYFNRGLFDTTQSDLLGRFEFNNTALPSAKFVSVLQGELSARTKLVRNISDAAWNPLKLELVNFADVTGQLVSLSGDIPIAGVSVEAVDASMSTANPVVLSSSFSDELGRFQFADLDGPFVLRVTGTDFPFYYQEGASVTTDISTSTVLAPPGPGRQLRLNVKIPNPKKGRWKTYSVIEGLLARQITSIKTGEDGRIWVASPHMISVFDGKSFIPVWRYSEIGGTSLLFAMDVYRNQAWFVDEDGFVFRLDPEGPVRFSGPGSGTPMSMAIIDGVLFLGTSERFFRSSPLSDLSEEPNQNSLDWTPVLDAQIHTIQTKSGLDMLTCGSTLGLLVWNGNSWETFGEEAGFFLPDIRQVDEFKETLWLSSYQELGRFQNGKALWTPIPLMSERSMVTSLLVISPEEIWIGTSLDGLFRYNGRGFVQYTTTDGLPDRRVICLELAQDGTLLVGTQDGSMARFDRGQMSSFDINDGLKDRPLLTLVVDDMDRVWMGSEWGGLLEFDGQLVRHYSEEKNGLAGEYVRSLRRREGGGVWAFSNNGISLMGNGEFISLPETRPNQTLWTMFGSPDGKGGWWLGHSWAKAGLSHLAPGGQVEPSGIDIPNPSVWSLETDSQGRLWAGTSGGLTLYDGVTTIQLDESAGIPGPQILTFCEENEGMWIGTNQGVAYYKNGEVTIPSPLSELQGIVIWKIFKDSRGHLWIGTDGAGVYRFNGIALTRMSTVDGLVSNTVLDIDEDGHGRIWLATWRGLNRYVFRKYSPRKPVIRDLHEVNRSTEVNGRGQVGERIEATVHSVDISNEKQTLHVARIYQQQSTGSTGETLVSEFLIQENRFTWTPQQPGLFNIRVTALSSDFEESSPASLSYIITVPWMQNPRISAPISMAVIVILIWASRSFFKGARSRKEAGQLKERLEIQERKSMAELAEANEALIVARDEADAANQAKSRFLANMSHEIRTPLNAVLGYAQLLQQRPEFDRDAKRALHTIQNSGEHLLHLINDILEISKIESGRMESHESVFNLIDIILDLDNLFRLETERKGLVWAIEYTFVKSWRLDADTETEWCPFRGGEQMWIRTDQGKLRQTLINLLSNAVKYTETGSVKLRIQSESLAGELSKELGRIRFTVEDTGEGINLKDQSFIFKPFSQARDTNRKKGDEGFGLGLAISNGLLELLGSALNCESVPGQGTRFSFELEALQDPVENLGSKTETADRIHTKPGVTFSALVVDDVRANRDVLASMLKTFDVNVTIASGGMDALKILETVVPDVAFLYIAMPEMDCWIEFRNLRGNPKNSSALRLLCSRWNDRRF